MVAGSPWTYDRASSGEGLLRDRLSRRLQEAGLAPEIVAEVSHMLEGRLRNSVSNPPPEASDVPDGTVMRSEAPAPTGVWAGPPSVLAEAKLPVAFKLPTDLPAHQEDEHTDERSMITSRGGVLERYVDLGVIGTGGMGEVRRVLDRDLGRTMAMKIVGPQIAHKPGSLARFIEEAQATSQLQHPGIVPIHELGKLADGRWYYTMREVRGRSLGVVIREVHGDARDAGQWVATSSGWTFRRLVDAFLRVCEAVSYAHSRGVVHRDLKPSNILVGEHGEVLVVDWGLAKVLGRPDLAAEAGELDLVSPFEAVSTDRSKDSSLATRMGHIAGTPAYMPPEQALGQIDRIDARSDVYALGAILYELLTGRIPYTGHGSDVVDAVLEGPPPPIDERAEIAVPEDLKLACEKAMARAQKDRYQSASQLARAVQAWLDGAKRREQALTVVGQAEACLPEAEMLSEQARTLRTVAAALLDGVKGWEPEEKKHLGWEKEDQAEVLERMARLAEFRHEQQLHGALQIDPRLPEAHALLVEAYLQQHRVAEAQRNEMEIARAETLLREHEGLLPTNHPTQQRVRAYLKGDGALTLVTDPPGAEVFLHKYEVQHRRLVPVFQRSLGRTPLVSVSLPRGSYLCVIKREGFHDVSYPVLIGRQEHWDGVRPGEGDPFPIELPPLGTLEEDDCYVPAGWFWSGGDEDAVEGAPRQRLWCDAFTMKRHPVTNRRYLAFLDNLLADGREDAALRLAPRERGRADGELGPIIYGRASDGTFVLQPDREGHIWDPEMPVVLVDWECAQAYAAQDPERLWRLPTVREWEKAGRGTDGRFYPWGDFLDPAWCSMNDSHAKVRSPSRVSSFPVDVSPYGVSGLAGNVRDWCAPLDPSVTTRDVRGGAWNLSPRHCRLATRGSPLQPHSRLPYLGFRLVR
jgi:serine/threonine protein kinase/formylglycine-generating enzyme required for sulfatase activity